MKLPQNACGGRRWHLTQRENVPASSELFPISRVVSSALNESSAAISCFLSASLTTPDRSRLPRLAPHRHRSPPRLILRRPRHPSPLHRLRAADRDYRHVGRTAALGAIEAFSGRAFSSAFRPVHRSGVEGSKGRKLPFGGARRSIGNALGSRRRGLLKKNRGEGKHAPPAPAGGAVLEGFRARR
jgi:hypothetical protein